MDSTTNLQNRTKRLIVDWYESQFGKVTGTSRDENLTVLGGLYLVKKFIEEEQAAWVALSRRSGLGWQEIAQEIGMTRQGAKLKFGHLDHRFNIDQSNEVIVRSGITLFNEMRTLQDDGNSKLELVNIAPNSLIYKKSNKKWGYKRLFDISSLESTKMSSQDGWIYVASWALLHYFKKPMEDEEVAS